MHAARKENKQNLRTFAHFWFFGTTEKGRFAREREWRMKIHFLTLFLKKNKFWKTYITSQVKVKTVCEWVSLVCMNVKTKVWQSKTGNQLQIAVRILQKNKQCAFEQEIQAAKTFWLPFLLPVQMIHKSFLPGNRKTNYWNECCRWIFRFPSGQRSFPVSHSIRGWNMPRNLLNADFEIFLDCFRNECTSIDCSPQALADLYCDVADWIAWDETWELCLHGREPWQILSKKSTKPKKNIKGTLETVKDLGLGKWNKSNWGSFFALSPHWGAPKSLGFRNSVRWCWQRHSKMSFMRKEPFPCCKGKRFYVCL